MREHILITGGAGFVGSSLALHLRNHDPQCLITGIDNLYRRGSELNVPRLTAAGINFLHRDVRSASDIAIIDPPPTMIIDAAAEPSVHSGYGSSPANLIQTNLMGTFNCLELARLSNAAVIFLSTSRVYPFKHLNSLSYQEGETRFELQESQSTPGISEAGISETFPIDGPRSLYGMTKLASELMIQEYGHAYSLDYIILRLGVVAGPGQMMKADQGVITQWVAAHHFRKRLSYIGFGGRGKQVRDVLHIDDLGSLILDQKDNFSSYAGQIFNVGGGLDFSLSLQEATELCSTITGNRIDIGMDSDTHLADVPLYISDYRKVSVVRGWKPRLSPERTLSDILGWITRNQDALERTFYG